MNASLLDRRPIIVAVAGPNGAGKTTFYYSFLQESGMRLVNADIIAKEFRLSAYKAAEVATSIRGGLLERGESFVFETVFSDPAGDKLAFLKRATGLGYTVLLCFIGIDSPDLSEERVTLRFLEGGHDVPSDKIFARYPRIMANLRAAIKELPHIWILDNSDLTRPYRLIIEVEDGSMRRLEDPLPTWLSPLCQHRKPDTKNIDHRHIHPITFPRSSQRGILTS